jgi:hypothetical protein
VAWQPRGQEQAGVEPVTARTGPTWSQFLRPQAEAILACDFFTANLLDGTQAYVLAVIEHATRGIRILGVTLHPAGDWTAQQALRRILRQYETPPQPAQRPHRSLNAATPLKPLPEPVDLDSSNTAPANTLASVAGPTNTAWSREWMKFRHPHRQHSPLLAPRRSYRHPGAPHHQRPQQTELHLSHD